MMSVKSDHLLVALAAVFTAGLISNCGPINPSINKLPAKGGEKVVVQPGVVLFKVRDGKAGSSLEELPSEDYLRTVTLTDDQLDDFRRDGQIKLPHSEILPEQNARFLEAVIVIQGGERELRNFEITVKTSARDHTVVKVQKRRKLEQEALLEILSKIESIELLFEIVTEEKPKKN